MDKQAKKRKKLRHAAKQAQKAAAREAKAQRSKRLRNSLIIAACVGMAIGGGAWL